MTTEFWFEVGTAADVVAIDGATVVGRLKPGTRYRAVAADEHWVSIPGPEGTTGYVLRTVVRPIATSPPPASPPVGGPPISPRQTSPP